MQTVDMLLVWRLTSRNVDIDAPPAFTSRRLQSLDDTWRCYSTTCRQLQLQAGPKAEQLRLIVHIFETPEQICRTFQHRSVLNTSARLYLYEL